MKFFVGVTICLVALSQVGAHRSISLPEAFDYVEEIESLDSRINNEPKELKKPSKPVKIENWPRQDLKLGQVSAVSVDEEGNPVIFHRGNAVWDLTAFNLSDYYNRISEGPIQVNTILTLDVNTGDIIYGWGANMFYMPHGITIDQYGSTWITDCAMHQVMKFRKGSLTPVITMGEKFIPGDGSRMCKPTAVAVASTGEVFISDGYCNSRIIKLNAAGKLIREIPTTSDSYSFRIPHQVALLEELDLICVADRENMRIICPKAGLRTWKNEPPVTIERPDMGRMFAVAAYDGRYIFAVNGPTNILLPIRGFTMDVVDEKVIDTWGLFIYPHAMTISPDKSTIYVVEVGPNRVHKFNIN